jgi:hypothetical protein
LSISAHQETQEQRFRRLRSVRELGDHANVFRSVSKRSPILGYNHNIGHRGLVFHVQTEDSGVDNPHIFTHLFHGGVIIFTRKIDYDAAADESVVKSLMQAQHKAMLKELKRGIFDERIDSFLGDHPDLTPRSSGSRDTIPDNPSDARLLSEPNTDFAAGTAATAAPAEDAAATAEMAVIAGDEWISTPAEITSSEVSDVFRIIMQPTLDEDGNRVGPPELRIESLKPGAPQPSRRIQRDTVEIHSTPPSDEPIELEHHAPATGRHRTNPPPPPAAGHRPAQRAATPSSHVSPRASGNVLVSRPPIRVDSHSSHSTGKRTPPPPPPGRSSRPMAPRTVREDPLDSLFDQQAISEKSLDEVILAYLSEDSSKDEP